jgi:MFS transporter, ACS family, hexuronate transporter
MSTKSASTPATGLVALPETSNIRWFVCALLFLATTINYMDRSVLSLIEPALHNLPFMGWDFSQDASHQRVFNDHFGNIVTCFVIAYGIGLVSAGRLIDAIGTKAGYALSIFVWALASMSHALVGSVLGFCIARFMLGIGEAGNFPAAIKATTEWFPPRERALATGIFNSGSNASSFIAPILIPLVTIKYGWHAAFLTTGSFGMFWLILWLLFPYNRLRGASTVSQVSLAPVSPSSKVRYRDLAKNRGVYAFAIAKMLTDPVWWLYLFWLPKYFHESYNVDLQHLGPPIIAVYVCSSFGSVAGGWLSGFLMKHGFSLNAGRKITLLICACCVLPVMFVPYAHTLFPGNVWFAVGLLSLAAAAHQGWSCNLFSTPTDMFPSTSVSTVVGIGGAMGALGGAVFTQITKILWTSHPFIIFLMGSLAYLVSLAIFQQLVPRLGAAKAA